MDILEKKSNSFAGMEIVERSEIPLLRDLLPNLFGRGVKLHPYVSLNPK
jgi:hypothetical protein